MVVVADRHDVVGIRIVLEEVDHHGLFEVENDPAAAVLTVALVSPLDTRGKVGRRKIDEHVEPQALPLRRALQLVASGLHQPTEGRLDPEARDLSFLGLQTSKPIQQYAVCSDRVGVGHREVRRPLQRLQGQHRIGRVQDVLGRHGQHVVQRREDGIGLHHGLELGLLARLHQGLFRGHEGHHGLADLGE